MPTPTAPADRPPGLEWDFTRDGIAKGARSLAVFAALYVLLVLLGLRLHENTEALTIIWPAAGLLFMALWLSPRRNWIWILAIQVSIELLSGACLDPGADLRNFELHRRKAFARRGDHVFGTVDPRDAGIRKTAREHLGRIAGTAAQVNGSSGFEDGHRGE